MVQDSRGWIMAICTKNSRKQDDIVSKLDDKERAFLSIIMINNGTIPGPKLKRIFLERYTYWVMQSTEKRLLEKGLLLKKSGQKSGEALEYAVPREFRDRLMNSFISRSFFTSNEKQIESISMSCCEEYSILWYLWQMDSTFGNNFLRTESQETFHKTSERKVEELFGIERESVRFLICLLKGLSNSSYFTKKRYKKWSDILNSPHKVVKEIFNVSFDLLREGSELGREEVGKDNIEFLFEELASLKNERWYSLNGFVSNARSTLFKCNQPYRWIHFNEQKVWNIMHKKLKMVGIVETASSKSGDKFFLTTVMGGYCFNKISEKKMLKMLSTREGKFIVHPNFEITMVSKELDPKTLLELAMFSYPIKLDTVSVFTISRNSVSQGVHLGLTTGEMTSFLKANSKGKIPQNVEYSITDWGA